MEIGIADRLYTIPEAADYLRMARSYLYKKVASGEITHFKPNNGKVYFTLEDLRAYATRGRHAASFELRDQADAQLMQRA